MNQGSSDVSPVTTATAVFSTGQTHVSLLPLSPRWGKNPYQRSEGSRRQDNLGEVGREQVTSSPGEAEPQAAQPAKQGPRDRSLNPRLALTPGVTQLLHFSGLWVFYPEGGCGGSDTSCERPSGMLQ